MGSETTNTSTTSRSYPRSPPISNERKAWQERVIWSWGGDALRLTMAKACSGKNESKASWRDIIHQQFSCEIYLLEGCKDASQSERTWKFSFWWGGGKLRKMSLFLHALWGNAEHHQMENSFEATVNIRLPIALFRQCSTRLVYPEIRTLPIQE
jgi:hypothetical protein